MEKQRFEREYSADDIWATYTYFTKAVLPVAEEANVRLALHPDDPPLAMMNGVAKLFVHYDGYKRAEQIAGKSKYWGLRLCVGTWMEGGDQMGKDVFGMIRDFGSRGKLFDIDFRNVSSPLPVFQETFPDEGYTLTRDSLTRFGPTRKATDASLSARNQLRVMRGRWLRCSGRRTGIEARRNLVDQVPRSGWTEAGRAHIAGSGLPGTFGCHAGSTDSHDPILTLDRRFAQVKKVAQSPLASLNKM